MKKYYKILFAVALFGFQTLVYAQPCPALWYHMGTGMRGGQFFVHSLYVWDTSFSAPGLVYAGGEFDSAGGVSANHIASWNGYNWLALGQGTNGEVDAITVFKSKVYAGGMFDSAGGILTHHIASCDTGNHWDSLLGGLNGYAYALKVYHNALYIGGSFTMANGIKVNRIAKWDGTKWDSVGAGFDSNTVYTLAVFNDTLYAGGSFTKSAGQTVSYIAKWNGTKWLSVYGGMNNTVYALDSCMTRFSSGKLYAGGAFTQAGGINTNYIAALNTSGQWDSLGSGTNDTVRALCQGVVTYALAMKQNERIEEVYPPVILVGGSFTNTGGFNSSYVGFWDGFGWDIAGGSNHPVFAVAGNKQAYATGRYNYIGGAFDSTYDESLARQSCNYVAQIQTVCGGFNELSDKSSISIYPNPSNGVFTIEVKSGKVKGESVVEIYNEIGEKVYSNPFNIEHSTFNINLSNQPSGVYLCRVIANDGKVIGSAKIVVK